MQAGLTQGARRSRPPTPEQPRTPATSMADASAQRPSEWAPEAGVGDQGHVVAVPAVPAEPKAAPEGERAPISRGQSVWAHPAAVQPVRRQLQPHIWIPRLFAIF